MAQIITGFIFIVFGICIGGVGIATAGVGIGVPMIPLGAYFSIRGIYTIFSKKLKIKKINNCKPKVFESTWMGKICLATVLIILGIGTSALGVGIPIILVGAGLLFWAWFQIKIKMNLSRKKTRSDI